MLSLFSLCHAIIIIIVFVIIILSTIIIIITIICTFVTAPFIVLVNLILISMRNGLKYSIIARVFPLSDPKPAWVHVDHRSTETGAVWCDHKFITDFTENRILAESYDDVIK